MEPGTFVLVRNFTDRQWCVNIFSHMRGDTYVCTNLNQYEHCIPLKGNEHMAGATADVADDYITQQQKWFKEHDCNIGSVVLLKCEAASYDKGWRAAWNGSMSDNIGRFGIVRSVHPLHGLKINFTKDDMHTEPYYYPYFVLQVIKS